MRQVSLFALVASSLSLAGCAGGSAFGLVQTLSISCGVNDTCPPAAGGGGGSTTTPPAPDGDGDGTPDDTDTDGSTGSGAGGNPTNLTPLTGARTIALEEGTLVIPSNGRTSLSTLSMTNTLTTATNTAAVASILDPLNKPTQLKIGVDTEGTGNSQWSVPILMDEYLAGTHDETWYRLGYFTGSATVDSNGYTVAWDAADQRFEYTTGPASFLGRPADYTDATLAANIALLMAPNANAGAGANYREYRALSKSAGRDEVLQVWAFDESYTLQYRNRSGGGEAKQQAWSFGGNATTAMPTSGSGIYSGRFAATAKSENWIQPDGSDINPNALWQVEGATSIAADFGTGDVSGTLTPETWSSYQSGAVGYYTWNNLTSAATAAQPNFTEIYGTVVDISGSIDQTTGAIPTNSANFTGEANLSGYETGDNPVYGGFFGTNAEEVAGVFSAYGIDPQPIGGSAGINDDRNAYLTINGAFHGDCQVASTGCTP